MLNSKFGARQAANVIAASGGDISIGSTTLGNSNASIESYVIAKYDYESHGPQELSLRKGDRLLLLDDTRHWWRVLNADNQTGFVPSNYVKREKQSLFDSIRRGIRSNTKSKKSSSHQSPSNCPLIPNSALSDIRDNSPSEEHGTQQNSSKPYEIRPDDNGAIHRRNEQPQSHSDILARELGPNFNGCSSGKVQATINNHDGNGNSNPMALNDDMGSNGAIKRGPTMTVATVKYNYKAQQPDELSLTKGATISVTEKSDDGWWRGELDGVVGWFPSNYVNEVLAGPNTRNSQNANNNNNSNSSSNNNNLSKNNITSPIANTSRQYEQNTDIRLKASQPPNLDSIPKNQIDANIKQQFHYGTNSNNDPSALEPESQQALSTFSPGLQAQSAEELSFIKDERLDIIEKPANDPDWWRARNQSSQIGLVPKNYVQIVPNVKSIKTSLTAMVPEPTEGPVSSGMQQPGTQQGSDILDGTPMNASESFGASTLNAYGLDQSKSSFGVTQAGAAPTTNSNNIQNAAASASTLATLAHDLEVKLNLTEKVWYHGVMSRLQCDQLLNAYADDGDFLVRNSETNAGDFSVSLKAPVRNKHFRVHYVENGFCIGQRKFESLDELVEHYKRTPIYTSASGEKMFLKKAYCR